MLTDSQVKKYMALFESRFKTNIAQKDALIQGEALVQLMKQIYKPIKINENEYSTKRKEGPTKNNS